MPRKVFLDYTQEELDRAYDQRAWAPNAAHVIERYGTDSAAARARLSHTSDIAYGPSAEEVLDVFPAKRPKAPALVFIHGGAWRAFPKSSNEFAAGAFVEAGAAFVVPEFATIPEVRLPEMAEQVRRAIVWVHRNAAIFGGDPDRIHICGHSSGGHLAAVLLTTDWTAYGLPVNVIKGGLCVSGMYDLHPVLLSARSGYIKITEAEQAALSPIRHVRRITAPIAIAYGDRESPEFKRQGGAFHDALQRAGHKCQLLVLHGVNHFEGIATLADPDSVLARIVLEQMALGSR